MVFFTLLAVPLLVALAGYLFSKGKVTLKELGVQMGVQLVVAASAAAIVHYNNVHDTEVWNGRVVQKQRNKVSCEHDYQCNPYPCNCDSKGNCSTCYHTCYEHTYDVDWDIYTSNPGEVVSIHRVDRQGLREPPRYAKVQLGEPTTLPHGYTNYIKAAPDSLFRHQGLIEKYKASIPDYPDDLYDYYHINKVVQVGIQVADLGSWDKGLEDVNADVGRPKQANVILVLAKGQPQEYFYALEEAWIGGKKNDIVLVVGVDDQLSPQWATVMAWTTSEMFKVRLRDDVVAEGTLTRDKVMDDLRKDVTQYYARKPMADFEYLEASITPTPLQWGLSLGISLAIAIGLTIWFIRVDVFGDEARARLNLDFDTLMPGRRRRF